MPAWIRARFGREEGQTMAEYAVVLAVITVAIAATFATLSTTVADGLSRVIGLF